MRELGVRIDTPISALLTLNEEEFCCFSFRIHRFSRSFTLFTALSTHAYARTHAHLAAHSLQSAPQSQ